MTASRKIIGMIPARLGSQRVPRKNLRLLNGKPLIAYIIESAKACGNFDEIYINSEADIFSQIANEYGIGFYKRPEYLSSNQAINDDFAFDFAKNIKGDILVQLLPTSPLITPIEIADFIKKMIKEKYDTLISVKDHQIACLYQGKPINFSLLEPHRSSQTMIPVESYATVLMAWTYTSFMRNMEKYGFAYHGADSSIGYYPLKGLSTIDIDEEDDFALAEVALQYKLNPQKFEIKFYEPKEIKEIIETDVPKILVKDGVMESDFDNENMPLVNIDKIIASKDNSKSWCHRVINTENNSATLISQLPGEGNRLHFHSDWNEWWYIVEGNWKWEIEGKEYIVKKGDIVFIEKNKLHRITATGNKPAIRLAVSKDKVAHIYQKED